VDARTGKLAGPDTPYTDVQFRTYRPLPTGDGPFPPRDYSDSTGQSRPWEVLPATILPTIVPTPVGTPEPSVPVPEPPALAAITSLRSGEVISGQVDIRGSATARDFQSYQMEYELRDNNTGRWGPMREISRRTQVESGPLDRWDTTAMPNGLYSVRLSLNSAIGTVAQARVIVTVRNAGG
jgi:hypothetical protein